MCVTCGGGTRGTSAATLIAEDGYAVKCMPGAAGFGSGGVRLDGDQFSHGARHGCGQPHEEEMQATRGQQLGFSAPCLAR